MYYMRANSKKYAIKHEGPHEGKIYPVWTRQGIPVLAEEPWPSDNIVVPKEVGDVFLQMESAVIL